jgi:hypothetical protein
MRTMIGLLLIGVLAITSACVGVREQEAPEPRTLVGQEAVDMIEDATVALSGIENMPQARDAQARLDEIDTALTTALARVSELSPARQERIAGAAGAAAGPFEDEVDRVLEIPGVPGTLRPVLASIQDKIDALRRPR